MATQINCLNLLAQALGDRLLGFHVALTMDLRLLYYVAASSGTLGEALRGIARCSAMLNEGIRLDTHFGQVLRIGFEYAGRVGPTVTRSRPGRLPLSVVAAKSPGVSFNP